MKYQFVKGESKSNGDILLYVRSEVNERRKVLVKDFDPYVYIREDNDYKDYRITKQEAGYQSIYGEDLKKVVMASPTAITSLKKDVSQVWEEDIDALQRFLIDKGIKSGFVIDKPSRFSNDETIKASSRKIRSTSFSHSPVICYLNMEIYKENAATLTVERATSPIVAISLGTNLKNQVSTFFLSTSASTEEVHQQRGVKTFEDEASLIRGVQTHLTQLRPDVITGWNLRRPLQYLEHRARKLGVEVDHSFSLTFDMQRGWRSMERGGSHALKDVILKLGMAKKEDIVARRYRTRLYKDDKKRFLNYCRKAVNYLRDVDEKRGLTKFFWNLKNHVGLTDLRSAFYNGKMINLLLLRELKGEVVLPSLPTKKEVARREKVGEKHSLEGGKVFEPVVGVHENVAVIDFARFYPSLLIANNISPELQKGESIYDDGTGVMTKITRTLWNERDRYEEKLDELAVESNQYSIWEKKRNIVKYLLNTTWAYMGWKGARIWDITSRKRVLEKGREALEYLAEQSKELGYEVVYGDTDSLFLKTNSLEDAKHITERLNIKALNIDLEGRVEVNLDKFFRKLIFLPHKTKARAAQKRYLGHVTFSEGTQVDTIDMAGVSRRDNAPITEEIIPKLCKKVLQEKEERAITFLRQYVKKIQNNEIPMRKLAIPRKIHKDPKEYAHSTPWLRGITYSNKHFDTRIKRGDYVKTLYVRKVNGYPPTREVSFLDLTQIPTAKLALDTERIIEKTIKMKVRPLLSVADISWLQVEGYKTLQACKGG